MQTLRNASVFCRHPRPCDSRPRSRIGRPPIILAAGFSFFTPPPPPITAPPPQIEFPSPSTRFASPPPVAPSLGLTPEEQRTIDLFDKSKESVVLITNVGLVRDRMTLNVYKIPSGAGSGFVYDKQGHIVTNYHVIKGAADIKVTLLDLTEWPATLVGGDEDRDVAVLQLQADEAHMRDLRPIPLGESSNLRTGQSCYAIGAPFSLDHSMTSGIISAVGREIESGNSGAPIRDAIQVSAATLPGNSGGPLLDSSGRLIGVNTAILDPSGSGSFAGIGFALPVDSVRGTVTQLIQYGRIVRPSLGITLAPPSALEQVGVNGVLVFDVSPNGPAARAGIRPTYRDRGRLMLGDIITKLGNKEIKSVKDLYQALDELRVGQQVQIDLLRFNQDEASLGKRVQEEAMDKVTVQLTLIDRADLQKQSPKSRYQE